MTMTRSGNGLSPELKGWIDAVVVPALVREYLSSIESKKLPCSEGEPVAECAATPTAIADIEGGR